MTRDLLEAVIDSPSTRLLTARVDRTIVGALTLVMYTIPTGREHVSKTSSSTESRAASAPDEP